MFIDLNRSFIPTGLSKNLERDSYIKPNAWAPRYFWPDILNNFCTVLLAEAGSGKTKELENQEKLLVQDNKNAFFIDISMLVDRDLVKCVKSRPRYERWMEGAEVGYFFLDSVDESKLTDPSNFKKALLNFFYAIELNIYRIKIVISSRPAEWAKIDLKILNELLYENLSLNNDLALKTLSLKEEIIPEDLVQSGHIKTFQLEPISTQQMEKVALEKNVPNIAEFVLKIKENGLEEFLARPMDLINQIEYWKKNNAFGSYQEVLENTINERLKEENEIYANSSPLTTDQASDGIRTLAAALTFEQKSYILIPGHFDVKPFEHIVDSNSVLPTWTAKQIKTLLNLAIFSKPYYGVINLYHRSIREYLTAKWLYNLIENRKHRRSIMDKLFSKSYEGIVIHPYMQPVVAWISLWDAKIRDKTIDISPQTLLLHGDITSLALDIKKKIFNRFIENYKINGHLSVHFILNKCSLIARKDLKEDIFFLLGQHSDSEHIKQFLFNLIWLGKIENDESIILESAIDSQLSVETRTAAIYALSSGGSIANQLKLIENFLSSIESLENQILETIIVLFFPKLVSVDQLIIILQKINNSSVMWKFNHIFNELNAPCKLALIIAISEKITLIAVESNYQIVASDVTEWLLTISIPLVKGILSEALQTHESTIVHLLFLATLTDLSDHQGTALRQYAYDILKNNVTLNKKIFWYTYEKYRQFFPGADIKKITVRLANYIIPEDFDYFLNEFNARDSNDEKSLVFDALLRICCSYEYQANYVNSIAAVKGDLEFESKFDLAKDAYQAYLKDASQFILQQEISNPQPNLQNNDLKMVEQLRDNLSSAVNLVDAEKGIVDRYILFLYDKLRSSENNSTSLTTSQWPLLTSKFSEEIAICFRDYCIAFWRYFKPKFLSEETDYNFISSGTSIGLSGIGMEIELNPNLIHELTDADAVCAFSYALREFNSYPFWFKDLVEKHAHCIKNLFAQEIAWQIKSDYQNPYILNKICQQKIILNEPLKNSLIEIIRGNKKIKPKFLSQILSTLLYQQKNLCDEISNFPTIDSYEEIDDANKSLFIIFWLCINPMYALSSLKKWLDSLDLLASEKIITIVLNCIFGHGEYSFNGAQDRLNNVDSLKELSLIAVKFIHPSQDLIHNGVFSPSERDEAQKYRDQLINLIYSIPGRPTFLALKYLSSKFSEMGLERYKNHLDHLAAERNALDAELNRWQSGDLIQFTKDAECIPKNDKDLFDLAKYRIDDVKFNLEEGDNSSASLWQKAQDETELRNELTGLLKSQACNKYCIDEENELADKTRTDIRFSFSGLKNSMPVEIKIADKWTCKKLLNQIEEQLIGKYMRVSQYGIFLLIRKKKGKWQNPRTKVRVNFDDLILLLKEHVRALKNKYPYIEDIEVFGICLMKRNNVNKGQKNETI